MNNQPAVDKSSDPSMPTEESAETTLTQHPLQIAAMLAGVPKVSSSPSQPPSSLGGYQIERILGAGGMGVVYLARDTQLDRAVALKTIKPEVAAHTDVLARFLREAKTVAQIEHENVTPIWQVGEEQGLPFIAMPLLRGESLADRLNREALPPLEVIVKVGRDVAEGLAAAHSLGLVHRDIKPANLWLETGVTSGSSSLGFARVKILDFGLARPAHDDVQLTAAGAILGTPAYMSPEQGQGSPVDHRADLFSLGVVLYRMATGLLPFPGCNTLAVLTALSTVIPPPVQTVNPAVPHALASLIDRLLSKSPVDRPASAREVADAIAAINLSVPGSVASVAARKSNRRKVFAGLVIALAATVGMMLALSGSNTRTSQLADAGSDQVEPNSKVARSADQPTKSKDRTTGVSIPTVEPKKDTPNVIPGNPESDLERRAAQWGLNAGGIVTIKYPTGGGKLLQKMDKLPTKEFTVEGISFDINSTPLFDVDLQNLRGLSGLRSLNLSPVTSKITDEGMRLLGGLATLTEFTVAGEIITHKGLAEIKNLPHLRHLSLYSRTASDEGLSQIKSHVGLLRLQVLGDSHVRLTNEGLKSIADMRDLELLSLRSTQISDLAALGDYPRLKRLELNDNPLTTEGLKPLKRLPSIEILILDGVTVTGDGLAYVATLPRLTHLQLQRTKLTDDGLARIATLKELEHLFLGGTEITDEGLRHLEGLISLKELDLTITEVTPKGVAALRKALPKCVISGP